MSNQALMEKYGVSERTVTRWRREGNPKVDTGVDIDTELSPKVDIPAKVDNKPTPRVDTAAVNVYPLADGRFDEIGRMRPVDGMVKVYWGPDQDDRMVPEDVWRERQIYRCVEHSLYGWSCTKCLHSNGVLTKEPKPNPDADRIHGPIVKTHPYNIREKNVWALGGKPQSDGGN